jgi:hypothetical protein
VSQTLITVIVRSCETSTNIYLTSWRNIPEVGHIHYILFEEVHDTDRISDVFSTDTKPK